MTLRNTLIFTALLFLIACNEKKNIPFPEEESGFAQPVSKTLRFTEPRPLQFSAANIDTIRQPKAIYFDFDKLPSKAFTVNNFKPLKGPIQTTALDWDNIPDSLLNFDTLPAKPFRLKKSILPKPAIVKAGLPKLLPGTTSGLLQFGEDEGLAGGKVTASLLDDQGNIWLATHAGLWLYTGETLYRYSFLNTDAIGGNYVITHMKCDKEGNMWATTNGDGIYIIDKKNEILMHDQSGIFGTGIHFDYTGKVWIGSWMDGLFILDKETEFIRNIRRYKEKVRENAITAIAEDKDHNIWLGNFDTKNGNYVAVVEPSGKKLKKLTKKEGLHDGLVMEFFEDTGGNMWMGQFKGAAFVSLKNKTISTINSEAIMRGGVWEITEDVNGQIWLAENDTVYVLNKRKDAVKAIVTNQKIITNYKTALLRDRNENIWIGTADKGFIIIDTKGPLAEHLTDQNGLSDKNIWGLLEDKNRNIWMGTYKGINIYEPAKNTLKVIGAAQGLGAIGVGRLSIDRQGNIFAATGIGFTIINPGKKTLFNFDMQQSANKKDGFGNAVEDESGQYWLGTGQGIVIYNTREYTMKSLDKTSGLLAEGIWDLVKDNKGNIWAASDSGAAFLNLKDKTISYIRETEGLSNNTVWKIVVCPDGEIWMATQKGISIINQDKQTITNLTAREGLTPEIIFDMQEKSGVIYAGSSDGLIVIDRANFLVNKKINTGFRNFGKRQGFPFNDYNQNTGMITSGGEGWWGIVPGLTVITQQPAPDTIRPQVDITQINIMDESPSFSSFLSIKKQLGEADTLWDATKSKYYLKDNFPSDSGYLIDNDIKWDSTSAPYNVPSGLVLPYNQNTVSFSFTNNDIKGRNQIVYRYILEGADKKWSDITEKASSKNYYNLSAGSYTFKVCTKGFNGIWSSPAEISFTVLPPWWKTWWAYILYILAGAFIITTYARYRSRQLLSQNMDLEKKISQRTAELSKSLEDLKTTQKQLIQSEKMASLGELTAGIAHEIQNPLNFVNNFSDVNEELLVEMKDELGKGKIDDAVAIANDVIENQKKINHHGKRADAIVKGMLQHSRINNGLKEPTDINKLADEYLRLAYHGLRAKDKTFNAKFETYFDSSIGKINVVPQELGRVILNLINNAFYVVDEKKKLRIENYEPTVSISTKKIGDKVLISVKDNGNGIPQKVLDKIFQPFFTTKPTGQGTGLGLSLAYDIVKAHGGELKVETKEGEGSEFIIRLSA